MKRCMIIVLLMTFALAGSSVLVAAEPIEIDFVTHWGTSGSRVETLERYIAEYNALQSDVKIVHVSYDWQTVIEKILLEIIAGVPPSIVHIDSGALPSFVTQGLLQPVPDDIAQTFRKAMLPGGLSLGSFDGQLWGPPTQNVTRGAILNPDLFNKFGMALEAPTTWDEMQQMAARFRTYGVDGDLATTGVVIEDGNIIGPLSSMAKSHGAEILDESGTKVTVDSIEWIETMEFMNDLFQTDLATIQAYLNEWFREDKAAVFLSPGSWIRMQFVEARGEEWTSNLTSAPFPVGQTGKPAAQQYGYLLAVPVGVSHPKEAWDFITWITTTITEHGTTPMGDIFVPDGNLPNTMADVQNQPFLQNPFMHGFIDALIGDYAFTFPPIPNLSEMHSQLRLAFYGQKSVAEALQQSAHAMQPAWDDWLEQIAK